jgi:hypothetical protein
MNNTKNIYTQHRIHRYMWKVLRFFHKKQNIHVKRSMIRKPTNKRIQKKGHKSGLDLGRSSAASGLRLEIRPRSGGGVDLPLGGKARTWRGRWAQDLRGGRVDLQPGEADARSSQRGPVDLRGGRLELQPGEDDARTSPRRSTAGWWSSSSRLPAGPGGSEGVGVGGGRRAARAPGEDDACSSPRRSAAGWWSSRLPAGPGGSEGVGVGGGRRVIRLKRIYNF